MVRAPVQAVLRRGFLTAGQTAASAAAVSSMRLEKPHSLSYQVRMRTKRPSSTVVWVRPKIEEAGWWVKSIDTGFSSLVAECP